MSSTTAAAGIVSITGASGFIGRHFCARLAASGWQVRALVRRPESYAAPRPAIKAFACDLPDRIDSEGLRGAGAVVHCAYVTRHRSLEEARRVNEEGTRRLLDACRAAGVPKFVFISSQSAHAGAASYYGRSKHALERTVTAGRDLVIRPGLVMGRGSAGLFERMCATVRTSKVIPLFGGGHQPLQTVHVDDLGSALESALRRNLTGSFTVAHPEPIEMGAFLREIAARLGRSPIFVPFPIGPALVALKLIEGLHVPFPVSSENLLGMKQLRVDDTRADLAALAVSLRSASEALDATLP